MTEMVLLGDEAVAMGAIHAGLSSAYAYPGTPSTEIMEFLIQYANKHEKPHAAWTSNEKTSYEEALGASLAGKRAMVSMKHVGLNVAADPFVNSALLDINGGLVVVVADDPGMHSSQNEQDSRFYADFARIICLEPTNQQQAYEMTREAFELSEKFRIPVMIRLVTRLAHSRAVVKMREARPENPVKKSAKGDTWILLPGNARKQWDKLIGKQAQLLNYSETCEHNTLFINEKFQDYAVITTGIALNYYLENINELKVKPSHLHISAYPFPVDKINQLARQVRKLVILEEGYPFLERYLRGIIHPQIIIDGKLSGHVPESGELNPDNIRPVLGLPERKGLQIGEIKLPLANRPPQLCDGCPHADSYDAVKQALATYKTSVVTSDIGCYTLGALPPYNTIESCVNMGASVSMAKGAAEAGLRPAVAVIGDSTFLHSGITPLIDAINANTPMTLIILDNSTVGMTGGQPTIMSSSNLEKLVLGLGVSPDHFKVIDAHRKDTAKNTEIIHKELEYEGLSVIIAIRECLETIKKKKKK